MIARECAASKRPAPAAATAARPCPDHHRRPKCGANHMADKIDALAAIGRYFATPAGHDLGAGVFNLYLRSVQERRGVCQITGGDFLRMGKMLILLDAPALVDTDAADKASAEKALTATDSATALDDRPAEAAQVVPAPKPPEEEKKNDAEAVEAVR